ncbi:MAG: DUF3141 domain-containing protein [Burkholderiales bacterium]|nr:DUF3141 domain-containing protein [Burkholderiales bacterium]
MTTPTSNLANAYTGLFQQGIFTGGAVARKEHDQIVNTLDEIERLPPGLYEMVIDDKSGSGRYEDLEHGDYTVRFELRKMDDILALDPDGRKDEAIFSTIAKVSEQNEAFYKNYVRPFVQAMVSKPAAEMLGAMSETRADAKVEQARLEIEPMIHAGGFAQALARILVALVAARGAVERRSAHIGKHIRSYLKEHRDEVRPLIGAEPIDWPAVIKVQTRVLMLEPQKAIEAIPALIPRKAQRELAIVIAAKALMLEPELGNADSKVARRVNQLLGVDYAAAARKLGLADAPRASAA